MSSSSPNDLSRETLTGIRRLSRVVCNHLRRHVGVGLVCAVGYFDPGNWSVDLQAGATFGYRPMLFVILLAGLFAIVLQVLAARLGCVTGLGTSRHLYTLVPEKADSYSLDLASHCRVLLHDHPKYPRLIRYLVLYPLYIMCEIAIISTDLAELLGSAIGICLLFPKLPLWAGVLLTGVDVFIFLVIGDPSRTGRPVAIVFVCFIILLVRVNPDWPQVFMGFLPSEGLFHTNPNAVYTAIGIVGATVMPHALFLGSNLSTQDRVSLAPYGLPSPVGSRCFCLRRRLRELWSSMFRLSKEEDLKDRTTRHSLRQTNTLQFVQAHLMNGTVDVVLSLLAVAVPINSAILILAATVFYTPDGSVPTGLFDMHTLILQSLGEGSAFIFALALVCSGQTASITATLSGQIVSEGFILWKISPFLRRLVTRLISMIPSMIVAFAFGRAGINTLLVASQVALSVVLPFVAFPLIYLTSSSTVMSVRMPKLPGEGTVGDERHHMDIELVDPRTVATANSALEPNDIVEEVKQASFDDPPLVDAKPGDPMDFSNNRVVITLAYGIWLVVLVANLYAIVMLGLGEGG
ncbi:natural resistance-associated macrophage protein-domain-containing protein [Phlebopus sp. FC_14]|nr:natural resistance-associated macrophage protein-domain-containing protein [Phlebopus sp. FC_14]